MSWGNLHVYWSSKGYDLCFMDPWSDSRCGEGFPDALHQRLWKERNQLWHPSYGADAVSNRLRFQIICGNTTCKATAECKVIIFHHSSYLYEQRADQLIRTEDDRTKQSWLILSSCTLILSYFKVLYYQHLLIYCQQLISPWINQFTGYVILLRILFI